jgi:hypothetical protein
MGPRLGLLKDFMPGLWDGGNRERLSRAGRMTMMVTLTPQEAPMPHQPAWSVAEAKVQ